MIKLIIEIALVVVIVWAVKKYMPQSWKDKIKSIFKKIV